MIDCPCGVINCVANKHSFIHMTKKKVKLYLLQIETNLQERAFYKFLNSPPFFWTGYDPPNKNTILYQTIVNDIEIIAVRSLRS